MTASTELVAPSLTAAEFKAKIIDFIKSRDFKAELLHQILSALPDDKLALFEEYRTNSTTDPISEDSYKWEREGGNLFRLATPYGRGKFLFKTIRAPYSGKKSPNRAWYRRFFPSCLQFDIKPRRSKKHKGKHNER